MEYGSHISAHTGPIKAVYKIRALHLFTAIFGSWHRVFFTPLRPTCIYNIVSADTARVRICLDILTLAHHLWVGEKLMIEWSYLFISYTVVPPTLTTYPGWPDGMRGVEPVLIAMGIILRGWSTWSSRVIWTKDLYQTGAWLDWQRENFCTHKEASTLPSNITSSSSVAPSTSLFILLFHSYRLILSPTLWYQRLAR